MQTMVMVVVVLKVARAKGFLHSTSDAATHPHSHSIRIKRSEAEEYFEVYLVGAAGLAKTDGSRTEAVSLRGGTRMRGYYCKRSP